MATSRRNQILDAVVTALRAISGPPNYFFAINPDSVSRLLRPVNQLSVFPALAVTEGSESRRWHTVGPQVLANVFEIVIWGYARAGSVAPDATHAKEALIHDVDFALAGAIVNPGPLATAIVDLIPEGSALTVETDEGLAAFMGAPDVGMFRMRVPVIYRQVWGQP